MNELNDLIRKVKEDQNLHDPKLIAYEVSAQLTDAQKVDHFDTLLPQRVREVLGGERASALIPEPLPAVVGATGKKPVVNKRTKASKIRDWFPTFISQSVFTGRGWIGLGECTAADLDYLVESRKKSAEEFLTKADEFDKLKALLESSNVNKVADLSPDDVKATLGL